MEKEKLKVNIAPVKVIIENAGNVAQTKIIGPIQKWNNDAATIETPVLNKASTTFTYDDSVALKAKKAKCDELQWPEQGKRRVLAPNHSNELLKDRSRFGDRLVNYSYGQTKQYFSMAKDNPTHQANLLNYRHYFIAMPAAKRHIAAII